MRRDGYEIRAFESEMMGAELWPGTAITPAVRREVNARWHCSSRDVYTRLCLAVRSILAYEPLGRVNRLNEHRPINPSCRILEPHASTHWKEGWQSHHSPLALNLTASDVRRRISGGAAKVGSLLSRDSGDEVNTARVTMAPIAIVDPSAFTCR